MYEERDDPVIQVKSAQWTETNTKQQEKETVRNISIDRNLLQSFFLLQLFCYRFTMAYIVIWFSLVTEKVTKLCRAIIGLGPNLQSKLTTYFILSFL